MIYLLHGENTSASRNNLLSIQKKHSNPPGHLIVKTELNPQTTTPSHLIDNCMYIDMFGNSTFIVFDISGMGRQNLSPYAEKLNEVPKETILVIYSDKELTKTNPLLIEAQKNNATILQSPLFKNANVFRFIDNVYALKRKQSYMELRNLLNSYEDEIYILTMLEYGLRSISYTKFESKMVTSLSPQMRERAKVNSENFTQQNLMKLYEELYTIDKDAKTGEIPLSILLPLTMEKIWKHSHPENT